MTHRTFALVAALFGVIVILTLILTMHLAANVIRLYADSMYSPAPTYGVLTLPNGATFSRDSLEETGSPWRNLPSSVRRERRKEALHSKF